MIIYKITNNINGKVYIGQTKQTIKKRWSQHCSISGNMFIQRSIRKHGKENFTIEEIDGANDITELSYLEEHYIHIYNSMTPIGYNVKKGGMRGTHTEEVRKRMAEAHIGMKYNITPEGRAILIEKNKNMIWTEEMRQKISATSKNRPSTMKGKKLSDEVRKEMSRKRKGFTSDARIKAKKILDEKSRKPVVATNIKTNEERYFISAAQAGKELNIDPSNVSRACRNDQNRSQSKGWKFKYK